MRIHPDSEWHLGWRIVAASALANATGISLLFYTFSMFLKPMEADFGLTRGQAGVVESLVIMAALGAPIIGRLVDRTGFHLMFLACTLVLVGVEFGMARWGNGFGAMALGNALIGFVGGGSASVLLTRPITGHFQRYRGLALGLVGVGISVSTFALSSVLEQIISVQGWRQGYYLLGGIALFVGLPAVMLLMPRSASVRGGPVASGPVDKSFLKTRDFWLITTCAVLAGMTLSGLVGQLSPMLQDSGLTARQAAWGVSAFMIGQFIGKLGGGWLLDRYDPRIVAATLTAVPSLSFVAFLTIGPELVPLLLATALLGLLQGGDVSIFSYFIARRFPVSQYGTVFGAMHGLSWIGNAIGLIGFGFSYQLVHGYWLAQSAALALLLLCAGLILRIRLPSQAQD